MNTSLRYTLSVRVDMTSRTFDAMISRHLTGNDPEPFSDVETFDLSTAGHAEMLEWVQQTGLRRPVTSDVTFSDGWVVVDLVS